MKKTPRKFQAGGATPAPSPDRVPPAEAAKMKAEKEQQRREAATQKKGAEKPNLGKLFKKGGAVRKFNEGGDVDWVPQTKYRNLGDFFRGKKMEDEPKAAPIENRTSPDAPKHRVRPVPIKTESAEDKAAMDAASAMASGSASSYGSQAEQDAPKDVKGGENVVTEVKKDAAPKAAAPKRVAPKRVAPKAAAPKPTPKATSGSDSAFKRKLDFAGEGDSNADTRQEGPRKRGLYERGAGPMLPSPTKLEAPGRATAFERRREERLQREAEERLAAKQKMKKGGAVKKYAKGGGVEAKGKTKGKIVKMAKGGSVRGYGISKVTNKTKIV